MQAIDAAAIVLAAGDGKRLKSSRPKVTHRVAGRPLLGHVLAAIAPLGLARTVVVASPRIKEIRAAVTACGLDEGIEYAVQERPVGTADAARAGLECLGSFSGPVLVTSGDAPLLETGTLQALLKEHRATGAAATMLTASFEDPGGYGRVVRSADGSVARVVEDRDATPDEKQILEVNTSIYVFDGEIFGGMLAKVGTDNAQGEYYITDVIELLRAEGRTVAAVQTSSDEVGGVNDRAQLAEVGRRLRRRACARWLAEGVTIVDPDTTYIDATVVIEPETTVLPFTFLEGATVLRSGSEVGPQCRIVDSEIGLRATVTFAVVRESVVGEEASVGPFASLRSGTVLERGARIGTFVETKNTSLGEASKAPHLSYLGDARIGSGVNIGAGTITCNWDGREKHETVIEDDAYVGSDTMFVAPVHMGKRSATGAGAVVRGEVPDDSLAVGVPARIIEGRGDRTNRKPNREISEDPRDNKEAEG